MLVITIGVNPLPTSSKPLVLMVSGISQQKQFPARFCDYSTVIQKGAAANQARAATSIMVLTIGNGRTDIMKSTAGTIVPARAVSPTALAIFARPRGGAAAAVVSTG